VRPSCAEQTDRLEPPGRLLTDVAVTLVISVWGDDGARAIGAIDDVGARRHEPRGHRQQIGKSAALTVVRTPQLFCRHHAREGVFGVKSRRSISGLEEGSLQIFN
jgi:hypothetical protein